MRVEAQTPALAAASAPGSSRAAGTSVPYAASATSMTVSKPLDPVVALARHGFVGLFHARHLGEAAFLQELALLGRIHGLVFLEPVRIVRRGLEQSDTDVGLRVYGRIHGRAIRRALQRP